MISRDHKISGHFALIRQLFQNRRKKDTRDLIYFIIHFKSFIFSINNCLLYGPNRSFYTHLIFGTKVNLILFLIGNCNKSNNSLKHCFHLVSFFMTKKILKFDSQYISQYLLWAIFWFSFLFFIIFFIVIGIGEHFMLI
jgi:hypothetical protein